MSARAICGCGATLGLKNQSGRCRSCTAKLINARPGIAEARAAGIRAKFDRDPVFRAQQAARLRRSASSPEAVERRRERGRQQYRDVLSRPDVLANTRSPEASRKRGESITNTRLAWCPPELRDAYRAAARSGMSAAEARATIEPQIAGTRAHAQLEVAKNQLRMLLKHERDLAGRY